LESLNYDAPFALDEAVERTGDLSVFFSNLADNFILLCLVELALSFLRAFGNDGIYHKVIRYSNFFAVAILFALVIAAEGTSENYLTQSDSGYNPDVSWTNVGNLLGAYYVIYWVISLPVVILSIIVLYSSIRKKHLQSVSEAPYLVSVLPAFYLSTSLFSIPQIYPSKASYLLVTSVQLAGCFLAASLLNLTRTTWDFSYAILYQINYNPYNIIPLYVLVVNPILYYWVTVVLFGLLIGIGIKKRNGLWSQQQQFPGGVPQQQQFPGGVPQQQQFPGGVPQQQQFYSGGPQQQQFYSGGPQQQQFYSGGPQQQQFYGGGQGQGVPTYQQTVAGSNNPSQQPTQAELIGSASPVWRAELTGSNSTNPSQQYYWTQYQQQSPTVQNQVTQVYEVAGTREQKA
jgi:hypothetical protein